MDNEDEEDGELKAEKFKQIHLQMNVQSLKNHQQVKSGGGLQHSQRQVNTHTILFNKSPSGNYKMMDESDT